MHNSVHMKKIYRTWVYLDKSLQDKGLQAKVCRKHVFRTRVYRTNVFRTRVYTTRVYMPRFKGQGLEDKVFRTCNSVYITKSAGQGLTGLGFIGQGV